MTAVQLTEPLENFFIQIIFLLGNHSGYKQGNILSQIIGYFVQSAQIDFGDASLQLTDIAYRHIEILCNHFLRLFLLFSALLNAQAN